MSESTEQGVGQGIVKATSREEILEEMRNTMAELFDLDKAKITLEARLMEDLDLDSIDAIDLAVRMQDVIGTRVDENALRKVRTISDVVDLIEGMLRARR